MTHALPPPRLRVRCAAAVSSLPAGPQLAAAAEQARSSRSLASWEVAGTPGRRPHAPESCQEAVSRHGSGHSIWSPAGREAAAPMTSSPVSRVVYTGRRNSSPRSPPSSSEIFTPAHEENVRFIYEAWQGVERDLRSQVSGSERGLVEEYVEKVPNPSLKTFKPIDLSDLRRRHTQDARKS
ncbi:Mapk-regulated corepressor-interacting protein 1 [Manis javanica]|nr:Mapk-regulated corepressor-interacting protein 1 [Manis javanica]